MNETTTTEYVYEYWDCRYCGQRGIRGDVTACSACGHPRDEGITFYRKEDAEERIDDEAQVDRFTAGADWVCAFCQNLNPAVAGECQSCGATHESSEKDYFDVQAEKAARQSQMQPALAAPRRGRRWPKVVGLSFAAIFGFFWWAIQTHEVPYQVAEAFWKRTIEVERYTSVEDTGWKDELKGDDIQRLSATEEIRRYEKRQVGTRTESYTDSERYQSGTKRDCTTSYESTGSGASKKVTRCKDVPVYSTRQVRKTRSVPVYQDFPIYDTKVKYRAKRFVRLRVDAAEGRANAPRWPEVALGTGVDGRADRQAQKTEEYRVTIRKLDPKAKGPDQAVLLTNEQNFTKKYLAGQKIVLLVDNLGTLELEPGDSVAKV